MQCSLEMSRAVNGGSFIELLIDRRDGCNVDDRIPADSLPDAERLDKAVNGFLVGKQILFCSEVSQHLINRTLCG